MDFKIMAFTGKVGAIKGKWSLIGDFIYLYLEDDTTGTANIISHPQKTGVDVDLAI